MRTNERLADIIINPIFNRIGETDLPECRESFHNRCVDFLNDHTNDLLEEVYKELSPINEIVEAARLFKSYTEAYEAGDLKTLNLANGAKANLFKLLTAVEESLDKSEF